MSGRDDDEERGERPKLSWSELDRLRDKARPPRAERRPRGAAAEARARGATQSYLKQLDQRLFAKGVRGGVAGDALGRAVRDALGTPELAGACRAYLDALGAPSDPVLVAAFLDARDRDVQLAALGALGAQGPARVALTPGLRSQLRILADGSDDELAERSEEILSRG
jgi:hypothetical protein